MLLKHRSSVVLLQISLGANPKARELKRNYSERNQAYKPNLEEFKPLRVEV